MKIYPQIACPYCSLKFHYLVGVNLEGKASTLVRCNSKKCKKQFLFTVKIVMKQKVRKLS